MSSKPTKEVRIGSIKASIWRNFTDDKKMFESVKIVKSYKDKEGNWKDTEYLSEYDLPALLCVVQKLVDEIFTVREIKEKKSLTNSKEKQGGFDIPEGYGKQTSEEVPY